MQESRYHRCAGSCPVKRYNNTHSQNRSAAKPSCWPQRRTRNPLSSFSSFGGGFGDAAASGVPADPDSRARVGDRLGDRLAEPVIIFTLRSRSARESVILHPLPAPPARQLPPQPPPFLPRGSYRRPRRPCSSRAAAKSKAHCLRCCVSAHSVDSHSGLSHSRLGPQLKHAIHGIHRVAG